MQNKIKYALNRLSEENELKVYNSSIDVDYPLKDETVKRIKAKTLEKLNVSQQIHTRKLFFYPVRVAIFACVAVLLTFTTVCAVAEPIRDRIIKIFNGQAEETEQYVYPYLETPEYTPITYPVEEELDFSKFDYSSVDKIIITSGKTGDKKTFYKIEEILSKVKQLKGNSPVSSRGYSGFGYHVEMYNGENELYNFSIFAVDDKFLLYYGVFEEFENIKYSCMYTCDTSLKEIEEYFDLLFNWNV